MNKKIITISIIIIILLISGWFFMSGNSGSKPVPSVSVAQNVALEASADKAIYNSEEEITINIKLTNKGTGDVCLGEGAIGNISFTSFTRNGEAAETRRTESDFLTSFTEILKSRLSSVAPGGEMEFNLKSEFDPGMGVRAMSATRPDDSTGIATFYNIEEAGQYEIELVYEYVAGPSDKCNNILAGQTEKAKVTFKVE